jgi:hypothetical protein
LDKLSVQRESSETAFFANGTELQVAVIFIEYVQRHRSASGARVARGFVHAGHHVLVVSPSTEVRVGETH